MRTRDLLSKGEAEKRAENVVGFFGSLTPADHKQLTGMVVQELKIAFVEGQLNALRSKTS